MTDRRDWPDDDGGRAPRPPDLSGVAEWFHGLDDETLDEVIEELRIGASSLQLAESIRFRRRFDRALVALVGEAIPDVDSHRFVTAARAAARSLQLRGMPFDPDEVWGVAYSLSRNPNDDPEEGR